MSAEHFPAGDAPLRRGAVAVILREKKLLAIRRAQGIAAPGALCFPGGGIEPNESEEDALVRELREELGVTVQPLRRVWNSVTAWRVELAWWLAHLDPAVEPAPNLAEVESFHWLTVEEMAAAENLLESNRQFLAAVTGGSIAL